MRNLKSIINGENADFVFDSQLTPRITKQLFNVEEIDVKGGDYTLNLNLPRGPINDRIFGYIANIQNASTLYNARRFKSAIELDGDILIQGTLTIDEITKKNYKCTLIGENIDFADQLDQLSLRDLPNFTKILWSGPASPAYSPFPNQYPGSEGYWENWWDTPLNSANELTGNEFCLPLISYGNFPAPATYTPWTNRTAAEGEFHFYNTATTRLSAVSIMPCPFFVTTVRKMFENFGYNVGGDYFTKDYYKNEFSPYVGESKPIWNYGLLGRLDVQHTSVPNLYGGTFLRAIGFPANAKQLIVTSGTIQLNENIFNQGFVTNNNRTFYWRPFFTDLTPAVDATQVSTIKNENYLFDETYLDDPTSLGNNQARSYIVPATGTYRVEFSMEGFGGRNYWPAPTQIPNPGSPNVWNYSDPSVKGFYLMIVKRSATDINPNFLGADGNGFVDNTAPTWPLVLDPNVLASVYYDTSTGMYDGTGGPGSVDLNNDSMTISISADVEVNELDTIEIVMAFCIGSVAISAPLLGLQGITIDDGSLITWKVTPLDLPVELDPAKFLPDITCKDFLQTIIKANNLYIFYDRITNTVYLNEYDNYFLPASAAIDWSDKCSLESDSVVLKPILQYKEVQFTLTTDEEDRLLELYQQETNFTYENLSDYYTEIKEVNLLYSPTTVRDYVVPDDNGNATPNNTKIDIPTLCNAEVFDATLLKLDNDDVSRSYNYNWRRLKYKGIKPIYYSKSLFIGDVAFSIFDPFLGTKFFYPYSVVEETGWNPTFVGDNNLYIDFWTKWLALLQFGTLVTLDAFLQSSDISNLDIRRPIQIGNDLFIINNIQEFDPSEDSLTKISIYKK